MDREFEQLRERLHELKTAHLELKCQLIRGLN